MHSHSEPTEMTRQIKRSNDEKVLIEMRMTKIRASTMKTKCVASTFIPVELLTLYNYIASYYSLSNILC